MFDFIQEFNLPAESWFWLLLCSLFVGMAKTGVAGLGMLIVPILATVFGGKLSSGLLLPMLSMGDIFAVWYYNRHAQWSYVGKLMPATIAGVLIGVFTGNLINDVQFKAIIGAAILFGLIIMIWQEWRRSKVTQTIPNNWWFSSLMGFLGGFSTMIGNASGPIMAIYLLSMRLPKNSFIGTGAWFFMIINLFKIPFHIWVWETINMETFSLNLLMFPIIMLGAFIGFWIVKKIPEKPYRYFVIITTLIAAIRLFYS
ncbi:MAG: sulfite exporter TauE/SafE family protein [Cyclobacteriaceae bacterium]|nr:sulfite exporter TauE/SafE family protein [Cyclobacteriaceae bacterium]